VILSIFYYMDEEEEVYIFPGNGNCEGPRKRKLGLMKCSYYKAVGPKYGEFLLGLAVLLQS